MDPAPCTAAAHAPLQDYWSASTRPLASLLFVAPLLVIYEAGVLWLGVDAMRNGADVWLRRTLDALGFSQYFLLPALLCSVLLGWHHVRRDPWKVPGSVLGGMLLESLLLAGLLLSFAHVVVSWGSPRSAALGIPLATRSAPVTGQLVAYLGAGIYEELLFRLLLVPIAVGASTRMFRERSVAIGVAIVATSVLFAAAHYEFTFEVAGYALLSNHGDAFAWTSFAFRFFAGLFFSLLFVTRGFGITAGAHALYDILACLA